MRDAMVDLPWQSVHAANHQRQYLALLSYLPGNNLDDTESMILRLLSGEPQNIDDLSYQCGLPVRKVSSTLTILETKGLIEQVGLLGVDHEVAVDLAVWEDDAALTAFVGHEPHRTTMGALGPHMDATAFVRWDVMGSDVPLSWDEAMRRSAAESGRGAP